MHDFFPSRRATPLPGGYMGKILRVDLTTGTVRDENLPEEPVLKKFIGGQSLASYILLKELPLRAKPLGPENIVVMMTGPLTGNGFTPGGTKMTAVYLSPLTNTTLGRGATSGYWATHLKAAGYDGVILNGAAPKPVYLFINEGKAEIRDGARLWGLGTRHTEDRLREMVGSRDAKVLCIGPAGENLNRAAMLANDYNHFASHSGGAVLGSKKLKAIVAAGTARPRVQDKVTLVEAGSRWRATLEPHDVKKKQTKYGHGEAWGALNNLNWRSTDLSPAHIEGFADNKVVLRPCFQCARLCPWDATLGTGEFKGTVVHFNAGGEWLDTFFNLGIKGNAVLYLAEKINDLGIECSHFSCGAGVAFEAWEKGMLGPDKTDGLKLEWGNVEAVERLLDMAAYRQGWLGNLLAEGPKQLAEAIGGDAPKWAVHTKGGTPAMHEWRPLLGQMLRELVASGGMKPQGGGSVKPPPDLRHREKWGPLEMDKPGGWAWSHVLSEQYRQFTGIFGGCWFAQMNQKPDGLNSIVDSFNAITGWNLTMDDALEAGHRSMILQSLFGTQRGWIADFDWQDVGARFLEPIPDGKYKGFTIAKWLPDLVHEYYRLSGRHEKTGRPFRDTLVRLGLEEFMEWSQFD
ncbi:MAG TPA: aldehyde ferredoxin oxidoreductase N-terminal domain-containing protein [Candidatus Binatia bacterium]|nr:aldehyde ferredoxin oxidoreductase N-terminal domain-containing protein [Candidatus Binatia bacterium]